MCSKGKCMCLEVETGALIFAIPYVILNSLGMLASICLFAYTSVYLGVAVRESDEMGDEQLKAAVLYAGLSANMVLAALSVGFCVAFSFAVVLIVGLCRRKANLVKCYFVYGVTKMVLAVPGLVVLGLSTGLLDPVFFLVLLVSVIYALILVLIRHTYKKFESEVAYNTFTNPISTIQKY